MKFPTFPTFPKFSSFGLVLWKCCSNCSICYANRESVVSSESAYKHEVEDGTSKIMAEPAEEVCITIATALRRGAGELIFAHAISFRKVPLSTRYAPGEMTPEKCMAYKPDICHLEDYLI
jgi:hypothetical protein